MATRKTSESAPRKAATKKAVVREVAAKTAAPDPMGCCTWTNNAGEIMRRDMRKSQCTFSGAIFVPDVSCT
jgi:hypothetical protein